MLETIFSRRRICLPPRLYQLPDESIIHTVITIPVPLLQMSLDQPLLVQAKRDINMNSPLHPLRLQRNRGLENIVLDEVERWGVRRRVG